MTIHPDDAPVDVGVWVRSAARGDTTAWAALVEHFGGLVWSIARAHRLGAADAEEVFQITWLRLTENVARLKEPDRVGAWLATTARNEALKVIRLGTRTTVTDSEHVLDQASGEESPEGAVLAAEEDQAQLRRARQLWAAFGQLPARCQQLLRMLIASPPPSYAEIGALLGIAIGSIGPTRGRCLAQLRTLLAEAPGRPVHP